MIAIDIIATINMPAHMWEDFFIEALLVLLYKIFMEHIVDYSAKCEV